MDKSDVTRLLENWMVEGNDQSFIEKFKEYKEGEEQLPVDKNLTRLSLGVMIMLFKAQIEFSII